MDESQLKRNIRVLYIFGFFCPFLIIMPIVVPLFQSMGLSMRQVFEAQAVFGLVVAVMEVPSGYLADHWGRAKTIRLGSLLLGMSSSVLLFATDYSGILLFEALSAAAVSLISGSDLALIYDTKKARHANEKELSAAIGTLHSFRTFGEMVAGLIGGALVIYSFRHVIVAQVITGWIPLVLSFFIVDAPFQKMTDSHWNNTKRIVKHLFWDSKILRLSFLNFVFWSLSTYYAVWIFQKHWELIGVDLHYFGYLWALVNLIISAVCLLAPKIEEVFGAQLTLIAMALGAILGYLALGSGGFALGIGALFLFPVCRGICQVVVRNAVNTRTPSDFRSTANSLLSFGFRGSFLITGPAVGWMIDAKGVFFVCWTLAGSFVAVAIILLLPLLIEIKATSGTRLRDGTASTQ